MYNAFKEKYPYSKACYKCFRKVFSEANIGFIAPRQDECDVCLVYVARFDEASHDSENCEFCMSHAMYR